VNWNASLKLCPSFETEMFHVYTAESDVLLRGDGGKGHSSSAGDTISASYTYVYSEVG